MDHRQLVTGDEKDYLDSKSKGYFAHRAGVRRQVRRTLNRRVRHGVRAAIRAGREV